MVTAGEFFALELEVAGGLGPATVMEDPYQRPPRVRTFDYEFQGWLGDPLLETVLSYIATRSVTDRLRDLGATGFVERPVIVSEGNEFRYFHPDTVLPDFVWLDVIGAPGVDDLGISTTHLRLVVSSRVLDALLAAGVQHCDITPWP